MVREAAIAALREHMRIGPLAAGRSCGQLPTRLEKKVQLEMEGGVHLQSTEQSKGTGHCTAGVSQAETSPQPESAMQSSYGPYAKPLLIEPGQTESQVASSGAGEGATVVVVGMRHFIAAISKIKPSVSEEVSL